MTGMTFMRHTPKTATATPLFLSMLSTTIGWLIDEEELNREVEQHLTEIRELNKLSDRKLAELGITRSQITAYVLNEAIEN
jgi:uncharacterized protein YjiS (DUF1127 family)